MEATLEAIALHNLSDVCLTKYCVPHKPIAVRLPVIWTVEELQNEVCGRLLLQRVISTDITYVHCFMDCSALLAPSVDLWISTFE